MLASILSDLRHAARRLRRAKGTTVLAALTLGLGVGANAILFALVSGVYLTALPYPDADRLAALVNHDGVVARLRDGVSIAALGDEAQAVGLQLRQQDPRAKSADGTLARSLLTQTVVAIAATASAVPGLRAGRVDPQVALNDERTC